MAVDASALLAIALQEDDAEGFARKLVDADACLMIGPSVLEAHIKVRRLRPDTAVLDEIMARVPIRLVAFDERHLAEARRAFDLYGKGGGHKAQLNFGDCLVYGFAKSEGLKLLFKGDDFIHTDIDPA